ncbi:MAG: hypothetical protein V4717_14610 [Bacteroidota bacterium]
MAHFTDIDALMPCKISFLIAALRAISTKSVKNMAPASGSYSFARYEAKLKNWS